MHSFPPALLLLSLSIGCVFYCVFSPRLLLCFCLFVCFARFGLPAPVCRPLLSLLLVISCVCFARKFSIRI